MAGQPTGAPQLPGEAVPPFYREAMALKWHGTAMDAVWRAASDADLLTQDEYRDNDLPPNRMAELITLLGWTP